MAQFKNFEAALKNEWRKEMNLVIDVKYTYEVSLDEIAAAVSEKVGCSIHVPCSIDNLPRINEGEEPVSCGEFTNIRIYAYRMHDGSVAFTVDRLVKAIEWKELNY